MFDEITKSIGVIMNNLPTGIAIKCTLGAYILMQGLRVLMRLYLLTVRHLK